MKRKGLRAVKRWETVENGTAAKFPGIRKTLRKMKARQWGILLLTGLLLAVIALPVSSTDSGDKNSGFGNASGTGTESGTWTSSLGSGDTSGSVTADVAKTELEVKLESILSSTEGVGRAQVLLMTGQERQGLYGSGGTEVTGVLIAAEGADNSVTAQNIQQAVMALFQIEAHKIKIMKMK